MPTISKPLREQVSNMKKLILISTVLLASSHASAAIMMHCNEQIHDELESIYGNDYSSFNFLDIDHNPRTGNSTYLIAIESSDGSSVVRLLLETKSCEFVSSQVAESKSDLENSDRLRSQNDEENLDDADEEL